MEFYDVGSSDLRELWDSYLVESSLNQDVEDDWLGSRELARQSSAYGVVLRDRLMTDAALGGPKPIKTEHSYSMLACSPPPVIVQPQIDADPLASQQQRQLQQQQDSRIDVTDMEEECFPAISMNTASGNDRDDDELLLIKGEPMSPAGDDDDGGEPETCVAPHSIHLELTAATTAQSSDESEEEDEDEVENKQQQQLVGVPTALFQLEEEEELEETSGCCQELPPTPPSSASSDSEGTVSASCSPERRDHGVRGYLQPRLYVTAGPQPATVTRQPIHTPLISCQPKGSTGLLVLTDEEKRTLIAEGYPVPTKLPLTKQEEKSLKKVRRKIKNKISAQESRRKKKEYMDGLERRVTLLTNENSSYRDKVSTLESTNRQLLKELQRLQALIQRTAS